MINVNIVGRFLLFLYYENGYSCKIVHTCNNKILLILQYILVLELIIQFVVFTKLIRSTVEPNKCFVASEYIIIENVIISMFSKRTE